MQEEELPPPSLTPPIVVTVDLTAQELRELVAENKILEAENEELGKTLQRESAYQNMDYEDFVLLSATENGQTKLANLYNKFLVLYHNERVLLEGLQEEERHLAHVEEKREEKRACLLVKQKEEQRNFQSLRELQDFFELYIQPLKRSLASLKMKEKMLQTKIEDVKLSQDSTGGVFHSKSSYLASLTERGNLENQLQKLQFEAHALASQPSFEEELHAVHVCKETVVETLRERFLNECACYVPMNVELNANNWRLLERNYTRAMDRLEDQIRKEKVEVESYEALKIILSERICDLEKEVKRLTEAIAILDWEAEVKRLREQSEVEALESQMKSLQEKRKRLEDKIQSNMAAIESDWSQQPIRTAIG